jgi:vitamin B12 transporter
MKTCFISLFTLFYCFNLLLPGEVETEKKEEKTNDLVYQLVVTANRAPQSSREIGSSLTVLPGTSFGSETADLLGRLHSVPGLSFTQSGSFGQTASVFIRGANSEHTLVLIDGIEVNDPSSTSRNFDFGGMNMSEIERIEVLRGAQSPLYGSDAIGGVVQIITKQSDKKGLSFHLGAETGRYDSFRENMSLSGCNEQGSFNLGVSRYDSKAFPPLPPRTATRNETASDRTRSTSRETTP